jgi:hypothetical protein
MVDAAPSDVMRCGFVDLLDCLRDQLAVVP